MRSLVEVVLLALVLVPVACSSRVRSAALSLGWRRWVLGAMVLLALGAQFWFGSRAFPFVDWKMYSSLPSGDPVVLSYDAELVGGGSAALVPGRYLGRESADRFVESLRRRVLAGSARPALRVLASMYERSSGRRVAWIVVREQRIALASGERGASRVRLRVVMAPP